MGTVSRALEILEMFNAEHPEIGLSELQRMSGRDKATLYRHLSGLTEAGFLDQNPKTKAYRLGPAITRLAHRRARLVPLRDRFAPIANGLASSTDELVHISLLEGDQMRVIYYVDYERSGDLRVSFDGNMILPWHASGSAQVVLAFMDPDEVHHLIYRRHEALTDQTITDGAALAQHLDRIRELGIVENLGTIEEGVGSISAPIFGPDETPVGAISVVYPMRRHDKAGLATLPRDLRRAARECRVTVGGLVPRKYEELDL